MPRQLRPCAGHHGDSDWEVLLAFRPSYRRALGDFPLAGRSSAPQDIGGVQGSATCRAELEGANRRGLEPRARGHPGRARRHLAAASLRPPSRVAHWLVRPFQPLRGPVPEARQPADRDPGTSERWKGISKPRSSATESGSQLPLTRDCAAGARGSRRMSDGGRGEEGPVILWRDRAELPRAGARRPVSRHGGRESVAAGQNRKDRWIFQQLM